MPAGRYVSQARDSIERLTEQAKPVKPSKPAVDLKAEALKLVDRYIKAYDDESLDELKQIWPGMDKGQISDMREFFRRAKNVKSNYTLLEEPQISGAEATISIAQVTTFVAAGEPQRVSGTRLIKLRVSPGSAGGWEISSVSANRRPN
jgi:hypothetical protein